VTDVPKVPKPTVRLYAPKIKPPTIHAPKLGRSSVNGISQAKPKSSQRQQVPPENRELIAQRDRLLEKFTVMQTDLGGAFYEMAIRDHVKLDVLTRKAAELQRVDIELGQVEEAIDRLGAEVTGECAQCGAPYEPGARFCSRCGNELVKG
jgi:hypothetical protein